MNRSKITTLLTDVLIRSKLTDRKYYAKEVTLDYGTNHSKRIDVMQFVPKGVIYASDIEKGIFICYEIKSCIEDVYSGNGLNFYGEKNYLVLTMDTYKKLQPDFMDGTFFQFVREHNPESVNNVGIMVAVPQYVDLRSTNYASAVYREYENPTPLTDNAADWKLWTAISCQEKPRKRSTTELLFCMLRSKHSNINQS